jgi:hypothetical protein
MLKTHILIIEVIIMAGIDFSLRVETETDPYGPMVIVVRTLFNGMVEKVRMQAALAADSILGHPGNGVVYRSAHIVFCGVYDEWCFSHVPMIPNGYGQFEVANRPM